MRQLGSSSVLFSDYPMVYKFELLARDGIKFWVSSRVGGEMKCIVQLCLLSVHRGMLSLVDTSTRHPPLTQCQEEEFTCLDQSCIPLNQRCDEREDCEDGSDEFECRKYIYNIVCNQE